MRSKNHRRTKAQIDYHNKLAELDCLVCHSPAEIDHLVGATVKHNKTHIGEWFVIALCPDCHRNGKPNRTNMEKQFYERYFPYFCALDFTKVKKQLFENQIHTYQIRYGGLPIPPESLTAIRSYCR